MPALSATLASLKIGSDKQGEKITRKNVKKKKKKNPQEMKRGELKHISTCISILAYIRGNEMKVDSAYTCMYEFENMYVFKCAYFFFCERIYS